MKILELRFMNLNSLYGEWVIDFTDPEYVSNGIFALTGPTGAGKSTILDAICLALYGATPRLGKITKSGNEIMSRQTGECYAEVLFESQTGRFRCHWEQRRARKKAEGKLQGQEHQIVDDETGKPIETKKSLVGDVIEEKTGMDFERFTRSILLAQGGFDTFLKADVEQKSKILEQITGTEIYSEISRRTHERQRDEREKLNRLQDQIMGIEILGPEQEQEIQQDLEVKQQQENELATRSAESGNAITWLNVIEVLKKEILNLAEDAVKLEADTEAFKPERTRLDLSTKAASLDGLYATLTSLRKQQLDDQAALQAGEAALPELEGSADEQAVVLKRAEQLTLSRKEELKRAAPLIQKVRSLDQKIVEQAKSAAQGAEECSGEAAKIEVDKQTKVKEQEKRSDAERQLETAERYLEAHTEDEWLVGGLAGIEEQFSRLLDRQQEIVQKQDDLKRVDHAVGEAVKGLSTATDQCAVHKQGLSSAGVALQQGKEVLSALLGERFLREYRAEKESLQKEREYRAVIAALEEHRSQLEDGKPCPLCGSAKHPFAEGNIPVPDEIEQQIESLTELITKAEDQEGVIKELERAEVVARNSLHESERLVVHAVNEKDGVEKSLSGLKDDLVKLQTDFDSLKLAALEKLQSLGITEIPESEIPQLLSSLQGRLKSWQEQVQQKGEIDGQIVAIDSELKRLDAVIETRLKALEEKQESLKRLKQELAAGNDERKRLYGDKSPDDEEHRLNRAIEEADEAEKRSRNLNAELQQKLAAAKSGVESLKRSIEQRKSELGNTEYGFVAALSQAGFVDENRFLEVRLTNEEREALSIKAGALDKATTELKIRQEEREKRLKDESAKQLTGKTLEELEPQFREDEESLKVFRDAVAALKHKLKQNTAAKERIQERQSAIDAQKNECHRWETLHGLIGSADGKKYRNFAQGLTFELMVSHANRQLEKMTDRYLLIRDEEHPLELNVVDNFQAGEIRPTRNLSGGESFIVSLTLALGLSKMASQKIRVDSLFLDEGFGTLDEDALETALETLSGLQQDGKLIGVISHINALKERISTQIEVKPLSAGRSALYGPGCHRVAGQSESVTGTRE